MSVAVTTSRYRERSLWLDGLEESLEPRPALTSDVSADVVIVGAGFTGLWSAYYLKQLQPDLRVVVVEREIAGFGPSGRNGGWASSGIAGAAKVYERSGGRDAVLRAERETRRAVEEIGRVAAAEQIDCGYIRSGALFVATTEPQRLRLLDRLESARALGLGEDELRLLAPHEVVQRVSVEGCLAATFNPHTARIDPARLVRGLARACERLGVVIYERTEALSLESGRVRCAEGTVSAEVVLRATEAFTTSMRGERRRFLPLYSLMIATEPLGDDVWADLGWEGRELISDTRHLFFYAQRTTDDRIAIGGRGAPYRLGSPIDEEHERNTDVRTRLVRTLHRHFPATRRAAITHHWGGPLGVPRDWCMSVTYDTRSGMGWAGGYAGHGVVAANVSGRTLADLVLGRDTDLVTLPWVNHRSRRWEPEPLRFVASRAIVGILGSADRHEDETGEPARRTMLVEPFMPPH
jgi:glycine/D-amino acid oxidase-like deaminating enzyme